MKLSHLAVCVATLASLGASLPAAAQFAKPEDAVKYRKAGMTLMASHFGRLGAMANGRAPYDAAAAAMNADLVVTLSKLPFAGFVEGTAGSGKGAAKANIWTERAKFDAGTKKMQDEVVKLAAAAKTGKVEDLKAAFGPTANACNACHDDFRNP